MITDILLALGVVLSVGGIVLYVNRGNNSVKGIPFSSIATINKYDFPQEVEKRLLERYPKMNKTKLDFVIFATKDYFLANAQKLAVEGENGKLLPIPSLIVFEFLQEFMKEQGEFDSFCTKVLGRKINTLNLMDKKDYSERKAQPEVMKLVKVMNNTPSPNIPSLGIPLLFYVDGLLNIENGFIFNVDVIKEYIHREKMLKEVRVEPTQEEVILGFMRKD